MAAAADEARWYVQVDNDVAFATDRWYSSGAAIGRVTVEGDRAIEWGALHEVFTPEAKRFRPGVTIDRAPTARFLGSGALHQRLGASLVTGAVQLGVRGKGAMGERVTDAVHRIISAPEVDWSREVSSKLEARLIAAGTHVAGPVMAHSGVALGNELRFAHAGVQLNVGPVAVPAQLLRFAPTPPFPLFDASSATAWGAWFGASVRHVAHDAALELGYDPSLPAPDRRHTITRAGAGIAFFHRWASVTLAAVQDSREFASQRQPQRFGSLALHVPF